MEARTIAKKVFSGSRRLIHTPRNTPMGTSGNSAADTERLVTESWPSIP